MEAVGGVSGEKRKVSHDALQKSVSKIINEYGCKDC